MPILEMTNITINVIESSNYQNVFNKTQPPNAKICKLPLFSTLRFVKQMFSF